MGKFHTKHMAGIFEEGQGANLESKQIAISILSIELCVWSAGHSYLSALETYIFGPDILENGSYVACNDRK